MTSNILHHINELKDAWRRQDMTYTKQQREAYDILLQARRERVRGFYAEDRVFKGSKAAFDKLALENQVVEDQQDD
jgi:hypothetical protein